MGLEDEVNDLRKEQVAASKVVNYGMSYFSDICPREQLDAGLAALLGEAMPLIPRKRWRRAWLVSGGRCYLDNEHNDVRRLKRDGVEVRFAELGNIQDQGAQEPRWASIWKNIGVSRNSCFIWLLNNGDVLGCGDYDQHYGRVNHAYDPRSLHPPELEALRKAVVETLHGWKHVQQGKRKD